MDLNFFMHEKHMNWCILGQNIVYVNGCYFKLKNVIFFLLFVIYLFIYYNYKNTQNNTSKCQIYRNYNE